MYRMVQFRNKLWSKILMNCCTSNTDKSKNNNKKINKTKPLTKTSKKVKNRGKKWLCLKKKMRNKKWPKKLFHFSPTINRILTCFLRLELIWKLISKWPYREIKNRERCCIRKEYNNIINKILKPILHKMHGIHLINEFNISFFMNN